MAAAFVAHIKAVGIVGATYSRSMGLIWRKRRREKGGGVYAKLEEGAWQIRDCCGRQISNCAVGTS